MPTGPLEPRTVATWLNCQFTKLVWVWLGHSECKTWNTTHLMDDFTLFFTNVVWCYSSYVQYVTFILKYTETSPVAFNWILQTTMTRVTRKTRSHRHIAAPFRKEHPSPGAWKWENIHDKSWNGFDINDCPCAHKFIWHWKSKFCLYLKTDLVQTFIWFDGSSWPRTVKSIWIQFFFPIFTLLFYSKV